jgi:hypothetical protein
LTKPRESNAESKSITSCSSIEQTSNIENALPRHHSSVFQAVSHLGQFQIDDGVGCIAVCVIFNNDFLGFFVALLAFKKVSYYLVCSCRF